jgi:predicted nucleic acid-binding protein
MYYVDTSVLVAYYCPEALSEKVEAFLTSNLQTSISLLTEVEP